MTTPTEHDGHLDIEVLADHAEGLLEPAQEARADTHLASCPRCRGVFDDLGLVSARLADAGDTGPMPSHVVDRLERALADPDARPAAGTRSTTVVPLERTPARLPRSSRLLQAVAACVVLLAGVAIGISAFVGGGNPGPASDDAGAGSAEKSAGDTAARADSAYPVLATGRNYTEKSVVAAVPGLLAGQPAASLQREPGSAAPSEEGSAPASSEQPEGATGGTVDPTALQACIDFITGTATPITPLAVDRASYQGKDALVILAPGPEPGDVDVWVVRPGCATDDALLAFLRTTLP